MVLLSCIALLLSGYFIAWLIWLTVVGYFTPNTPRGPLPIPIFGNLLSIDEKKPYRKLTAWARKYGPVYRIFLGASPAIVISEIGLLRKALGGKTGQAFSGRPALANTNLISSALGLVNSEGPLWQENRKFALDVFRQLGAGRQTMEEKIQGQVSQLLSALENERLNGNGTDICYFVRYCIANVVMTIAVGKTWRWIDADFAKLQERVSAIMKIEGPTTIANYLPSIARFLPQGRETAELAAHVDALDTFFTELVEERLAADNPQPENYEAEPTDYLAAFLRHMRTTKGAATDQYFTKHQAKQSIMDLFIAGIEDTTEILAWSLLFMILNPDIQSQIRQEISDEIGSAPSWEDRTKLPFTMAAIYECMRLANTEPTAALHATTEDIEFGGFTIPKRTIVLPNCWAIHMNSDVFRNPTIFSPSRFLDFDPTINCAVGLKEVESIVPFGVGKRRCLGEGLARMEVFLIFTAILCKYKLSVPPGYPKPSTEPQGGLILAPMPYTVSLEPYYP